MTQRNSLENRPNFVTRNVTKLAVMAGAGAIVLGACGDDITVVEGPTAEELAAAFGAQQGEGTTTTVAASETSEVVNEGTDFTGSTPVIASDEELATGTNLNGDFFCGGGYDKEVNGKVSREDLSYKMDFLLENQDIAKGAYDVLVTDSKWGFGEEAAEIIANSSFARPETVESVGDKTLGDAEKDALLVKNLWTIQPEEDTLVANGTCRFGGVEMPARDLETLLIKGKESGGDATFEGFMLTQEDYQSFVAVAKNLDKFFVYQVNIKDAEGNVHNLVFIVANSNGCDNPARVPDQPPVDTPPTTTEPETPDTTTTTEPETPDTTTTTAPDKPPTGTTPQGGGGSGGDPENGDDPENDSDDDGYGSGDRELVDPDNDGIHNEIDKCPNQAETWNGYQDDDGCPDTAPVVPEQPIDDPSDPNPVVPTTGVAPTSTNPPVEATTSVPAGTPENPTQGTAPALTGFGN